MSSHILPSVSNRYNNAGSPEAQNTALQQFEQITLSMRNAGISRDDLTLEERNAYDQLAVDNNIFQPPQRRVYPRLAHFTPLDVFVRFGRPLLFRQPIPQQLIGPQQRRGSLWQRVTNLTYETVRNHKKAAVAFTATAVGAFFFSGHCGTGLVAQCLACTGLAVGASYLIYKMVCDVYVDGLAIYNAMLPPPPQNVPPSDERELQTDAPRRGDEPLIDSMN